MLHLSSHCQCLGELAASASRDTKVHWCLPSLASNTMQELVSTKMCNLEKSKHFPPREAPNLPNRNRSYLCLAISGTKQSFTPQGHLLGLYYWVNMDATFSLDSVSLAPAMHSWASQEKSLCFCLHHSSSHILLSRASLSEGVESQAHSGARHQQAWANEQRHNQQLHQKRVLPAGMLTPLQDHMSQYQSGLSRMSHQERREGWRRCSTANPNKTESLIPWHPRKSPTRCPRESKAGDPHGICSCLHWARWAHMLVGCHL